MRKRGGGLLRRRHFWGAEEEEEDVASVVGAHTVGWPGRSSSSAWVDGGTSVVVLVTGARASKRRRGLLLPRCNKTWALPRVGVDDVKDVLSHIAV